MNIKKISTKVLTLLHLKNKKKAELSFWKSEIERYIEWFTERLPNLYGEYLPVEKVQNYSLKDNSILTWHKAHQEKKYLDDLMLDKNAFKGLRILDIGSGPIPSATVFTGSDLYCLDPLLAEYVKIGFPIHYYGNTKFISASSENIPVKDHFFDAIISVNAIDHVDDFNKTAKEIRRVLKPGGKLRMHVHYHKKTGAEPVELNDKVMEESFRWCDGFKKISESKNKHGHSLRNKNELYTVWSN